MKKATIMNIITTLHTMCEDGGATLRKGEPVQYATGYQVGLRGKKTRNIEIALDTVLKWGGNAGLWKHHGFWYIDESVHIDTLAEAMELGRKYNQLSIYDWATGECLPVE